MKLFYRVLSMLWLGVFSTGILHAQDSDLQALKKQMQEMQAAMQTMQADHQKQIETLTTQMQSQQKLIEALQKGSPAPLADMPLPKPTDATPGIMTTLFPTTDDSVVVAATPFPPAGFPVTDNTVVAADSTTPALTANAPITLAGGGKNFMNISFVGQFSAAASTDSHLDSLEVGDHDPQQRGFNARNLELVLDGAVDPYFEGFANIVFKLDNNNESGVEVEEAFMQTSSLPYGLQVKAGQFFSPLGRINSQHPHAWDFVDAPLVNGRLNGPDGLRGVGAQISWVTPLPWYSQFQIAFQNGQGGTGYAFRNPGEDGTFMGRATIDRTLQGVQDLVIAPRWENSFDINSNNTVLAGVSAAFGPNDTGASSSTQVYAADLFYKWKPDDAEGGFPFVKWQTEALYRKFNAGRGADDSFPIAETFNDWGAYSQVVWGFKKGWTLGVRGDYLHMDDSAFDEDEFRQSRTRVSTALTWYPTEFSKLRLQYNHDFLKQTSFLDSGNEDSVFLQFEFSLGSHGAHKF